MAPVKTARGAGTDEECRCHIPDRGKMRELLRTTDPVLLSWLTALLRDGGIEAVVLDTHTSILEGSVGALPRRLMVHVDDFFAARRILTAAGHEVAEA